MSETVKTGGSGRNASLLIAAKDKVQVRQGSTSMTLDGDIYFTGGEFRIQCPFV